jgi:tetratricopeptide (TPR) repeat protein
VDFSKHIQKADEALRRRNWDFAIELYRQLLDLDPDLGAARAGLRRALRKRHDAKRGGRLLRAIGGSVPLARAKTMLKLGRHAAGARALEDYLAGNPLDPEANLLLGQALEAAGHFQSACAVFEFLAEIAPDDPEGLKRAGAMMRRTGEPARALRYYERALEADPRDREALKARKDLAAETALSDTGLDRATHSRELIRDKGRARALERDVRRHRSEDDLRQELAELEAACEDGGGDPDAFLHRAEVHERLGELEPAAELLDRALSYRDLDTSLAARGSDLRIRLLKRHIARASRDGDEEGATALEAELRELELAELRRRVAEAPAEGALRLRLGKALLRAGDLDGAAAELQRVAGDRRLRPDAQFFLGLCFQRKGILDLARSQLTSALEGLEPGSDRAKEILYSLGSISEAEGDPGAARSFYIRIYEVDIGYRDVAEKMEQLK